MASGNPAKKAAVDRARAQARAKLDALDESLDSITLTLHGKGGSGEIEVPAFLDWEDDALARMKSGDFRGWARSALDDENFIKWEAVRPTNRTSTEFLDAWADDSGEDLGESEAS